MPPPTAQAPVASLPASVVAAEQRAREFLAGQKWRKARDELKPLVKADRDRFLPLLIQANLGLAREMMAKGQSSEAQQVLSYLATIAPAEQLRAVELELSGKAGADGPALPRLIAALTDTTTPLSEAERVRLADLLVLTFEPAPGDDPAGAALAVELRALQDALLALSQARWEAVTEHLRAISRRSALGHWAVFVKGLAAFYGRDLDKAERCFRSLPPDSVPERASRACLLLAGRLAPPAAGKPPPEAVLESACRLSGLPGLGRVLLQAEAHWRAGALVQSYRTFRDAVRAFPTHGLDPLGMLAEFYFHAPFGMVERERETYMSYFDGLISRRQFKHGTEEMFTRRMFALLDAAVMPAVSLREDWESFLRNYEILHGKNPRFASLAYGWLGEQLAMRKGSCSPYPGQPVELRDAQGALTILQRSIELNPDNLQSHLVLCSVHEALKQTSQRNRLLDTMTARFPDEKSVLLRAAQGCIERKAFVKGLHYLDRARQLDPLDPALPELTTVGQRRLARQHFQQRRPDKARQILAQTEAFLVDNPDDFNRSRWSARARHGVMEQLWGDYPESLALLAQARALAPNGQVFVLFIHLASRFYENHRFAMSPFLADVKKELPKVAGLGAVVRLLRVLEYWRQAPEQLPLTEEERLVKLAFEVALRHPFTRAEGIAAIEGVGGSFTFEDAVRKLLKKLLRDDPKDPQVRLLQLTQFGAGWHPMAHQRQELDEILAEALRRRDDASVRKARELLRSLNHPPPLPPIMDDGWGEDDEDDDDAFDPNFGPAGAGLPDLPAGEIEQFAEIMEQLRSASEADIRKLRKQRPAGMPEEFFDVLLQMAKVLPPPSALPSRPPVWPPRPPPAPRPIPPRPGPPPPDPNQPNLF